MLEEVDILISPHPPLIKGSCKLCPGGHGRLGPLVRVAPGSQPHGYFPADFPEVIVKLWGRGDPRPRPQPVPNLADEDDGPIPVFDGNGAGGAKIAGGRKEAAQDPL